GGRRAAGGEAQPGGVALGRRRGAQRARRCQPPPLSASQLVSVDEPSSGSTSSAGTGWLSFRTITICRPSGDQYGWVLILSSGPTFTTRSSATVTTAY